MNSTSATSGRLTITRRTGQALHIGANVVVEVIRVNDIGQVRLRVTAPRDVPILRDEILRRTK